MEKILHVNGDNYNLGGAFLITYRVEKYLRNYGYRYDYMSMDHFDNDSKFPIPVDDTTYSANLRKNRLFGHLLLPFYLNKILKKNNYKIIHIDTDSAWKAILYAIPAKKNKLKVIVHSHSSGVDGDMKKFKKIIEKPSKYLLYKYVDKYISCSQKAKKWIVPPKYYNEVEIVKNGIDFKNFYYSENDRNNYRSKYNLENKLVIGNVAMFTENKNQMFLIDIFNIIKSNIDNSVLILIGKNDNEYGKKCIDYVKKLNLEGNVIFTGTSEHIREMLCAMDIFVLPSIFEGAPLSLYEAQATGLISFSSTNISNESQISHWSYQISSNADAHNWANEILKLYKSQKLDRKLRKLDVKYSLEKMAKTESIIYNKLMEERNDNKA